MPIAHGFAAAPRRALGTIRWGAIAAAGVSVSALLVLEGLQRPGFDIVLFSADTSQWQLLLHVLFLTSVCAVAGTIVHQLTRAPRKLERAIGWIIGPMITLCGIAIGIVSLLVLALATVTQYVTITADDGTQFLVRAHTWEETRYTVLQPADGRGLWYSDGASILTEDTSSALAAGEYVLERTPNGYRLSFGSAPDDGRPYELEW
ncbi:hypothetical protein [Agromyces sp. Root81]|uniref:hypothetical protein n=1 Tax=Agromyces sp. Root81 TaxID=1736601 RepID=UPI000AC02A51|nr:hypothetical protein [Agromyces sp. Root81]